MTSMGIVALVIALGQTQGQVPAPRPPAAEQAPATQQAPAPGQPGGAQQPSGAQQAPAAGQPGDAQQAPAAGQPGDAQQAPPAGRATMDEPRLYREAGPLLPLDEAIATAISKNLDLKIAQARLDQARTAPWQAWSGYLPRVFASGGYTHNPDRVEFGGITILSEHAWAGQVEASQAVFAPSLFFVIPNSYRRTNAAELGTEGVRRTIAFSTAQAYYGVASLRQLIEVSERLLEISRRQERDAQIRLRAGTIAKVGLVRAEIDRARAEQDVYRARNSYLSAKIALAALLDRKDLAFEVADPPPVQLADALAELEGRALRDRTDVQAAAVDVEIARGDRNATAARYLPNVGVFIRYQAANEAGFTGQPEAWVSGATASWSILDGGLREAQIREGNARIDESLASLAAARSRAITEVRQSLLDYESARANALKAKEQRDLAAENQRLVDVSYRAGAATALEQADATTALRNAEIAFQTESLQAQIAGLRVLLAAGASDPRAATAAGTPAQP
jgi:outer membrane protein TolC